MGIFYILDIRIEWAIIRVVGWIILGVCVGSSKEKFTPFLGGMGGLIGSSVDWITGGGEITTNGWAILAMLLWGIVGMAISAGWSRRKQVDPLGAIKYYAIGLIAGMASMFVCNKIIMWIANLLGVASCVLMEPGICSLSIWAFVNLSQTRRRGI